MLAESVCATNAGRVRRGSESVLNTLNGFLGQPLVRHRIVVGSWRAISFGLPLTRKGGCDTIPLDTHGIRSNPAIPARNP